MCSFASPSVDLDSIAMLSYANNYKNGIHGFTAWRLGDDVEGEK